MNASILTIFNWSDVLLFLFVWIVTYELNNLLSAQLFGFQFLPQHYLGHVQGSRFCSELVVMGGKC